MEDNASKQKNKASFSRVQTFSSPKTSKTEEKLLGL
jgi:hypothetical protein